MAIMTEEETSRVKRVNVYTNAMATMLVYTSFFAGTMLMPTLLRETLGEQTAFYSMAVHSLSAAISCPFSAFFIKHFGAKITLIVGSVCCVFFYLSMMVPNTIAIYLTQSVFGFGLALVRPASLKFLVRNSSPHSMGRDTGIHWGWFMSSMIWGNGIVCIFTRGDIDDNKRCAIYAVLGSLNLVSTVMFVLLRPQPASSNFDDERAPLLEGMKEDLNPRTFSALIKETFSLVVLRQTLWLLPSMLAAGFYFTMYCVEIPTMIGEHLALFGMIVGIGELIGSVVLGRLLTAFGYVLVTILSGALAIIALLLTYTSLHKNYDTIPETYSMAMLGAIALAYGVSDAGNNTALSTIIGRLFAERSEVIFCVLSCIINLAAMTWYFIYTVVNFETIITATGLTVFASMVGIFMVVRPK